MSFQSNNIKKRHSFYTTEAPHSSPLHNIFKSDNNIIHPTDNKQLESNYQFYKKYEYDEIPVKDDCSFNDHSFSEGHDSGTGDNKDSIAFSDLDKLEIKILSKMSQELQTDVSTVSSLDSNIKLFKTTVQQIFDNFYSNMKDFELYKKKFNDILLRNKGDSVIELEEFISNMLQYIGSSDSSLSHAGRDYNIPHGEIEKDDSNDTFAIVGNDVMICKRSYKNTIKSSTDSYKNDSLSTKITVEDQLKLNNTENKSDTLNIYLVTGSPSVEIKMNDRNLLSEINLRDRRAPEINHLASAENIKKLAAKRLELEEYLNQKDSCRLERNIPVKNSNAKKNIHLNEDFENDREKDENKFFIFKICSYICKKLRKS